MLEHKTKIGNSTIELQIDNQVYHEDDTCKILGYPVAQNLTGIKSSNILEKVHEVDGYFLIIISNENEFILANDITGGFRLYYLKTPDGYFFTDNYEKALDKAFESGPLAPNQFEIDFWRRHDYTTGGETFFNEVKKMPPGAILTFNRRNIEIKHYFKNLENKPDYTKYLDAIHSNLSRTVSILKERGEKIVLLFSGGYDSTLLALELMAQSVDFTPVYFQLKPSFKVAQKDTFRCIKVSKLLDLNTQFIEIDLMGELPDLNAAIDSIILNRHIIHGFFLTSKKIKEQFGDGVVVISGQSADNVFSYGPTYNNLKDTLVRSMFYVESNIYTQFVNLALAAVQFFKKRKGKDYKLFSYKSDMYLLSFFDEVGYMPIYNMERKDNGKEMLTRIILPIVNQFKDRNAQMMFLKIYGYLQGPANQIVYNAFHHFGIHKALLPFSSPDIIYGTVKYRNNKHDIFNPKYVVMDLIRKHFAFEYPDNIKAGKTIESDNLVPLSNIQNDSNKRFEERLQQLLEKYTAKHTTPNAR